MSLINFPVVILHPIPIVMAQYVHIPTKKRKTIHKEICHIRNRYGKFDFQLYYDCKKINHKRIRIVFSKYPFYTKEDAKLYATISRRWIINKIGYLADINDALQCREEFKKLIADVIYLI